MKKQPPVIQWFLHILLWIAIVYIADALATLKYEDVYITHGIRSVVRTEKSILPVVLLTLLTKAAFIYLGALVVLPYCMRRNLLAKGLLLCLLLMIMLVALEITGHYLIQKLTDISYTELKQFPFIGIILYLLSIGIILTHFFVRQWIKSQQKISELQRNQLATELNFLKSQINPHFLFNTLNNLFSLAQHDGKEEIANAISRLSHLMRYMLHDSDAARVELAREVEYMINFIELAKMRYTSTEAEVVFKTEGNLSQVFIAPMLLIPFVENAFKHGVSIGKRSRLSFLLEVTGSTIIFSGTNPDHSKINNRPRELHGIGLHNVEKRIHLLYNGHAQLNYETKDDQFMFSLKIPVLP